MMRSVFNRAKQTFARTFNKPLLDCMQLLPTRGLITLCDIGAAGEIEPRWKPFSKNLQYIGFEPDKRSRERILNQAYLFKSYEILPHALSDVDKPRNLNLCRKPQVSSLYKPNRDFLDRFPDSERFDVMQVERVDCVTLDKLNLANIDFLKLDIEGAENDVIKGAQTTLNLVLGLELEVEFIEIYSGQGLFGDICNELSSHGFEFVDFVHLSRWQRNGIYGHGQCVAGDALFLKSPETLIKQSSSIEVWSTYISILLIYRRFDMIDIVLSSVPENIKRNFDVFERSYKGVVRRDDVVRRALVFMNRLIQMFGSNYRLHLIR